MSATHPLPASVSDPAAHLPQPLHVLAWPIDPASPYTATLHEQMGPGVRVDEYSPGKLRHRYDVWHVHFPEALLNIRNPALAAFKLSVFRAMIDLVRLRGGKIVWTLHNLRAHDALHPALEARHYRLLLPRIDGVISLSPTGLAMAREKFPALSKVPAAVIPHGHYRDQYPRCTVDARRELNIDDHARVILFFGEVRPYKNVDTLVRAFRNVKTTNAVLVIAGRPKSAELGESIAQKAAEDSRVQLNLRFIQREEVANFFAVADLVVLPYRNILNSGAALLALSFNRPVLVPDLGSMGDLKNDFGADWVRTFSGNLDSVELESALAWAGQPRSGICPMPEKYRWQSIRAETVRFYRRVVSIPRRSG